jgi:hypothetical protein
MDNPVYSTKLVLQHLAAGICTKHERSWVRSRIKGDRHLIDRVRTGCAYLPVGMRHAIDDMITTYQRLTSVFLRADIRATRDNVMSLARAFATYTRTASVVQQYVAAREQWLLDYAISLADQLDEQQDQAMVRALTGHIRVTQMAINADIHRSFYAIYASMVLIDAAVTSAESLLVRHQNGQPTPRSEVA